MSKIIKDTCLIYLSNSDLEKVVKCPQAEISEICNVLKIAWFATKCEQTYICVLNVCVAWWNPQILIVYPQFIALYPQFYPQFFSLKPQISFNNQPKCLLTNFLFPVFNSSSSILCQNVRKFVSKCPQNSVILDKMSASVACTACSFFQVCPRPGS